MNHRRVVTGTRSGREIVVEDGQVQTVDLNGVELSSLWKTDGAPSLPNDGTTPTDFDFPGPGGVWVCTFTVPPRHTIEYESDLLEFEGVRPGYHSTDTVDVDVILEGEISLEIEDGSEIALKAGDSLIVNGTGHAWHNRTDRPATVLAVAYGANRAPS
jgi:hypothetical protein